MRSTWNEGGGGQVRSTWNEGRGVKCEALGTGVQVLRTWDMELLRNLDRFVGSAKHLERVTNVTRDLGQEYSTAVN